MDDKKHMKDVIQDRITSGEVSMKPKMHFTLHLALLVLVSLLVLALSVAIANFILFTIRVNGHEPLLGFGLRGIVFFLFVFPWALLILDILSFMGLLWLLKQFRIGYRSPVIVLFGLVVLVTAGASLILDRGFRINDRLIENNERYPLPSPVQFFYKQANGGRMDGICRCEIIGIHDDMLVVKDTQKKDALAFTVHLPKDDRRATTTDIEVGDVVLIASDADGDEIRAFGVRKIDDSRKLFRHFEIHVNDGEVEYEYENEDEHNSDDDYDDDTTKRESY